MVNGPIEETDVLTARGATHGDYSATALTAQTIKNIMRNAPSWKKLSGARMESLDAIAVKLARILHGDPNYRDHWQDIAGYATLAERSIFELEEKK